MCGICGAVWNCPDDRISVAFLDKMLDRLAHRGPDGRGVLFCGNDSCGAALAHRRLAIIDLSPRGQQPMTNEDGSLAMVFNGEIYNEKELREPLIERGHRFTSDTDCEVILHLYEEYGESFLERINGMFAFALWDERQHRLLLVRDRIGKKPLFYTFCGDQFLFASEMKSLLASPKLSTVIAPTAIDDYLTYQYVPHPNTIFRDIDKLPPAHIAVWENGTLTVRRYWNPHIERENEMLDENDWRQELRRLLTDAVRIRMRSDVPIGAFLSGGIDSTITVGLMQQLTTQRVRTFSIGFDETEYDETEFAAEAAKKFGTRHERLVVRPDPKFLADVLLPKLVRQYDEPFADSSAIPTWYLCELTKRAVTVALSGDGGDELFAGYYRYQAARIGEWAERLPLFVREFLAGTVANIIPNSTRQRSIPRRLRRLLEALAMEPLERYLQWISIFNSDRRRTIYTDEFKQKIKEHNSNWFLKKLFDSTAQRGAVSQASLTDIMTYLPCDLMTKVDIASMAHSLECRCPLLDYRVVELATKMPSRYKIRGRVSKTILRETFRDLLPETIQKRGKQGFAVPLDQWFRKPLKEYVKSILLDNQTTQRGIFKREVVEDMLYEHFDEEYDHSYRIWALLFMELWFREHRGVTM
ncbi:MAG: asparagine synthase (glutamine-hydrolyzing) [Planctomycetaceae bacterium]|nr:asparagine synthase (glutamine-hydrolyzing) [Planctomycetaceae bacterium]